MDGDGYFEQTDGTTRRERAGATDRRDYLRTMGVVGAAAALGSGASNTAAAQSNWEGVADQRIAEHRQGRLVVQVENQNGRPVPDADVAVEMQGHEFGFGTAINAEFLLNQTEWGETIHTEEDQQRYREAIAEQFNTVVLANYQKWNFWEDDPEIADEAVQWSLDQGLDVRGHVCLWGSVQSWAVPPRIVEAMGDPWASDWSESGEPDPDPEYVREESMAHLEEIIAHYGDDITEWEIVNEVLHATAIIEALEGSDVTPETAPILGEWYERAEEVAAEHDVDIATNDYNVLAGEYTHEWDRYETQLDYLANERDVDIDGVGMQSHHYADERVDPAAMWDALDRYAQYADGLRITEFDMFGTDWDGEMQAEYLHRFLKVFFSHPAAETFVAWGFWDPLHWGDQMDDGTRDALLYDENWSEKPAYDVWQDLVFDEWWTDESGPTDDSGAYAVDAFLGEHEVTVETAAGSTTETVSVTDSDGTTTVTVTVGEGSDSGDGPDYPEGVTDPDGDGYYEDLNGNGEIDFQDVVRYSENMGSDEFRDDAEYYDYTGDGEIDVADLVELFEQV